MKKIRLVVAQRYLRRYGSMRYAPDVSIECISENINIEYPLSMRTLLTQSPRAVYAQYTPKTKVFLYRENTRIAQITKGLPTVGGYFKLATGEFQHKFPY